MSYFSENDIEQIKKFIEEHWITEDRYKLVKNINRYYFSIFQKCSVYDKFDKKIIFCGKKRQCDYYIKTLSHQYIFYNLITKEKRTITAYERYEYMARRDRADYRDDYPPY